MLYYTTWLIARLDLIKYLCEALALLERLARWQVLLFEYDIIYVSQKAIKRSVLAEFFTCQVLDNYQPLDFKFPDEDLMNITVEEEEESSKGSQWKMYFDGASNALGHGIDAILISPEGDYYPFIALIIFYCTNNVAEYEACIIGLQVALEKKAKVLKVYRDSALVIYQLHGE